MEGCVCSQHEVAVLYTDRIVVHPSWAQARPRPPWAGESLVPVGGPKLVRDDCLTMTPCYCYSSCVSFCVVESWNRVKGAAGGAGPFVYSSVKISDGSDVCGLRALLPCSHVVLDPLVLLEVAVTLSGDRAEMNEHIRAAIFRSDEAEPLLGAEPLHGTCCHVRSLLPFAVRAYVLPFAAPA